MDTYGYLYIQHEQIHQETTCSGGDCQYHWKHRRNPCSLGMIYLLDDIMDAVEVNCRILLIKLSLLSFIISLALL